MVGRLFLPREIYRSLEAQYKSRGSHVKKLINNKEVTRTSYCRGVMRDGKDLHKVEIQEQGHKTIGSLQTAPR